jgi:uncharacterized protein (DUF1015 family)
LAQIFPFKAYFPSKGKEYLVSANIHVDDLSRQKQIVKENEFTYLNVVKPYLKFDEDKQPEKHFPIAKQTLDSLISNGVLVLSDEPSLYIYRQNVKSKGMTFLGLVCTVSVEDYFSDKIKKHENTLTEKEAQLINHIEHTGVIGEPVLLTHLSDQSVKEKLESCLQLGELVVDFEDECQIQHLVCKVTDPKIVQEFQTLYTKIDNLYIADGHHRSAASAGFFDKNKINQGRYLAYIVPPEYLRIDSFHRTFKSDIEFDENQFIEQLKQDFIVTQESEAVMAQKEKDFGLCLKGKWYKLHFNKDTSHFDPVKKLDVSILEEYVFKKILNIQDSKSDKRLDFLRGSISTEEIQKDCGNSTYDFVFTVYPCNINQVFEVSDNQLIMPPKSTYIEPKMRTGLFIQNVNLL